MTILPAGPPRSRPVTAAAWVVVVAVTATAGFFAGRATLRPPVVDEVEEVLTVTVAEATVGRSSPMNVIATWPTAAVGVGAADGVLTSVDVVDGASVDAGAQLFTVDLRPVVVGAGDIPSFRDLAQGDRGSDVIQLQEMLRAGGYLDEEPDGVFGPALTRAVQQWQGVLGIVRDGVVRAGDVVWVPELPARVTVPGDITVGARLSPGRRVVEVLAQVPDFTVTLVDPGSAPPAGQALEVLFDGVPVPVVVARAGTDAVGAQQTVLYLTRPDGSPVCGNACDQVPVAQDEAYYAGRRIVVEEATGPSVPLAALATDPDGEVYVLTADGERIEVRVLSEGDGRAVLDGVDVGTVVRVSAQVDPG